MPHTGRPEISLRIVVEEPIAGVLLRLQRGRAELVAPTSLTRREAAFDFKAFGIGRMAASSFSERTVSVELLQKEVAERFLIAVTDASEAIAEPDETNNILILALSSGAARVRP